MFRRSWPLLIVIPLFGLLVGLALAGVLNRVLPMRYESFSVIEIKSNFKPLDIAAEKKRLTGAALLTRVSQKLDLPRRWSTDSKTTLRRLNRIIKVTCVKNTDLLHIRARHTDAEEAFEILQTLFDSYDNENRETWEQTPQYQRKLELREKLKNHTEILRQLQLKLEGMTDDISDTGSDQRASIQAEIKKEQDLHWQIYEQLVAMPDWGWDPGQTGFIIHDKWVQDDTPEPALSRIQAAAIGFHAGFPLALAIMVFLECRQTRRGA